jgi:hypothetical protein
LPPRALRTQRPGKCLAVHASELVEGPWAWLTLSVCEQDSLWCSQVRARAV